MIMLHKNIFFTYGLSVLLISFIPSYLLAQKPYSKKPNIIFILADDMGYGDIGAFYQNLRREAANRSEPWMYTPHLDKLASSGAMLTNHYCGAPVCAPSRATLLSGLSQAQANVRNNQFDKAIADDYTLGNILQKAGYTTGIIGKWGLQGEGLSPHWVAHPLKRGFDYFYGYIKHQDGHEHYPKEWLYRKKAQVWENYTNVTGNLDKCYTGDLFTAVAKKWIKEANVKSKTKPFFLYLAYDIPHAVLELPTQAYPAGGGLTGGMQWIGTPGNMITTASGEPDTWIDAQYNNATWDDDKNNATPEVPWPETYKRYATCISRIDNAVGDLMKLLKDIGIAENTFVVFTSDNGPSKESYLPKKFALYEPDFFKSFGPFDGIKRDVWEGGIRVPAIAVWPRKIRAGSTITNLSAFYDWVPTFANAADLPAPAFSDGNSMLPLLTGQIKKQDRTVYVEYFEEGKTPDFESFDKTHRNRRRNQMQMYRKNDTLAVRYNIKSAADDFEIYDIVNDPGQKRNLALGYDLKLLQIKIKQTVLQIRRTDSSSPRPYDSSYIPATETGDKNIKWRFYNGRFPWMPTIENLTASKNGNATSISGFSLKFASDGMLYMEGFINAPVDGIYIFSLKSNTSIIMKLHEANMFNTDFKTNKTEQKNSVMLAAGWHPFRLYYNCKKGMVPAIEIAWSKADGSKRLTL